MSDMPLKARTTLDRELTVLRDNVLKLSHLVDGAIERSVQALKDADVDLARQVIADDEQINALRYQIEQECYLLLVLHQPAARDLRAIVTAIHIVVELERIGDHARGIAKLAITLSAEPPLKPLIDVPRMAQISREMLHAGLQAYLDYNADLAAQTAQRDDEVDHLDEQVYRELLTYMISDPRTISRATYLLWVSHNLERIADRITNICERVVFMVTGDLVESGDR
ncbi:MAG: phosphate signaling complex protein PhoU [Chloroflexota bacterium]